MDRPVRHVVAILARRLHALATTYQDLAVVASLGFAKVDVQPEGLNVVMTHARYHIMGIGRCADCFVLIMTLEMVTWLFLQPVNFLFYKGSKSKSNVVVLCLFAFSHANRCMFQVKLVKNFSTAAVTAECTVSGSCHCAGCR